MIYGEKQIQTQCGRCDIPLKLGIAIWDGEPERGRPIVPQTYWSNYKNMRIIEVNKCSVCGESHCDSLVVLQF